MKERGTKKVFGTCYGSKGKPRGERELSKRGDKDRKMLGRWEKEKERRMM